MMKGFPSISISTLLKCRERGRLGQLSRCPSNNRSRLSCRTKSIVGYIEALVDCKVTKTNRDIPEKNTIVSSREFKYSYKLPRG